MVVVISMDVQFLCITVAITVQSRERVPMGGTHYKSAKEGGGYSFECFVFINSNERMPMSCL